MKNKIINILNIIYNTVSNTLFPICCAVCKSDGEYLCNACEGKLDLNYILDKNKQKIYGLVNNIGKENWIYAKYKYQNYNLKKLEYKIKYNHHPKLAEKLGEYSYEFIIYNMIKKNNLTSKKIYIIPIPISESRLKERGYNQTEYIAKGVQNKNQSFKILNILNRKNTKKLKDIYGIENRSIEIVGSMYINNLELKISKEDIFILIDDITTTGSTFYEARRALVEYGITLGNIYSYAIAH